MIIDPEHFRYLYIQHGEVADATEFPVWRERYLASISAIARDVREVMRPPIHRVLDIGSGLGGVHVLLSRDHPEYEVTLVDGLADAATVKRHATTFNNMAVAMDFLGANGVRASFIDAAVFNDLAHTKKYDLVVSFASYCFHYPPETYLDTLIKCVHKDSVLVLDVRRGRPEWLAKLQYAFGPYTLLNEKPKLLRVAFRA